MLKRCPDWEGKPIAVSFGAELTAHRGKLLSGKGTGVAVHAGSDIRRRTMVLDAALGGTPDELFRIFIHEAHHFVWVRLGNPRRLAYEWLVRDEMRDGARGELGWSAELAKERLKKSDRRERTRAWREYVCESFCDTAAWLYSPVKHHDEWTLGASYRKRRRKLMERITGDGPLRV
jgi:hypothetical protein